MLHALKLKFCLQGNPASVFFIAQLRNGYCLATITLILDIYL